MINMELKKATSNDLEMLLELAITTFENTYAHLNDPEDFENYMNKAFSKEQFLSELNDPAAHFYILEDNNDFIGYVKLNLDKASGELIAEESVELERIYLIKSSQGKGYGWKLVEKAIEVGKEYHKNTLWLGVWQENHKAIQFYKRCGFEIFGTHIFTIGKDDQTDYLMKLSLIEG